LTYGILEHFIIAGVFIGMIFFEKIFEYRDYSCPEYCSVRHEHIKQGKKDGV